MTPAEIRFSFIGLLDVFKRSYGETRVYMARHVLNNLSARPWLADQIPDDVRRLAETAGASCCRWHAAGGAAGPCMIASPDEIRAATRR